MQDQNNESAIRAKLQVKTISGEENQEVCQQLLMNLAWMEEQENYSIYKVEDLYYIVLFSYTVEGKFQVNEIPFVNSEFKALGSIINFDDPE